MSSRKNQIQIIFLRFNLAGLRLELAELRLEFARACSSWCLAKWIQGFRVILWALSALLWHNWIKWEVATIPKDQCFIKTCPIGWGEDRKSIPMEDKTA